LLHLLSCPGSKAYEISNNLAMDLRFWKEFDTLKRVKNSVYGTVVFVLLLNSEALERIWTDTNCLDIWRVTQYVTRGVRYWSRREVRVVIWESLVRLCDMVAKIEHFGKPNIFRGHRRRWGGGGKHLFSTLD
jgi:hypothetical protein